MQWIIKSSTSLLIILLLFSCGEEAVPPYVSAAWVMEIGTTEANVSANVIADGGSSITSRGICWSTSPHPTVKSDKTNEKGSVGSFIHTIEPLMENTTYFVRPFAMNTSGIGYGEEAKLTTYETPINLQTRQLDYITNNSALSGGVIQRGVGTKIEAIGVCWSKSASPTIDDTKTIEGDVLQNFRSSLTGLTSGTTYFVRAYAISYSGTTFYGNELSFTTQ